MGWISTNDFRNELSKRIEFSDHYFMMDVYADWSPKQVCMKSAQVGFSTLAVLKTLYAAGKKEYNIIYTLPTFDFVRDFVPAKVDSMIINNPVLQDMAGNVTGKNKNTDAMQRKRFGNNFIWYRGTHTTQAALSHTSDLNVYDEYDASNLGVIDMYSSRLQYSKYKGEWSFANPILPGGISARYEMSDRKHWMIKCNHCNLWQNLNYEDNICEKRKAYICKKCDGIISEEARRFGEWKAEDPDNDISGYHINQLMAPWVPASELVYKKKTQQPATFYNMMLGLPYVEKDDQIDVNTIRDCVDMKENNKLRNFMGVDVGHKHKHYVLGNHDGIFKVGTFGDWSEFDVLMRRYNPLTVIDANPDFYPRDTLVDKYRGQVFVCFYKKDREKKSFVKWGEKNDIKGSVYVDRSQAIQSVVNELSSGEIKFNTGGRSAQSYMDSDLKEYIQHWGAMYRTTQMDQFDIPHTLWNTEGRKPDHFVHATVYFRTAGLKVPRYKESFGDVFKNGWYQDGVSPTISPEGRMESGGALLQKPKADGNEWLYM